MPRFASEPDIYRQNHPWAYPPDLRERSFDPQRDAELLSALAAALRRRL